MTEARTLDFQRPDALTIEAAGLLFTEIYQTIPKGYMNVGEYIDDIDPDLDTHYALTRTDAGLLAASAVIHGIEGITQVCDLAVQPNRRGNGYGRVLMRHIAKMSVEQGDSSLRLIALEPGFFTRLGFTKDSSSEYWIAGTEVILNS